MMVILQTSVQLDNYSHLTNFGSCPIYTYEFHIIIIRLYKSQYVCGYLMELKFGMNIEIPPKDEYVLNIEIYFMN